MKIIEKHQIEIENMYNMNKTGFSIENIKEVYIMINKELQTKYQIHLEHQE